MIGNSLFRFFFVAPVFNDCMLAAAECFNPEDQNGIEKGASTNT
jgi:hypothetical protein